LSVIIQARSRFVMNHQVQSVLRRSGIKKLKKLRLIDGIAATIPASHLADLASIQGLTVTPDAPVHVSGYNSSQLWPYAAGVASLKVMNSEGVAKTSDVINACQWILANKAAYNIRIANFSLHSASRASFLNDPLDKAVERLWFNGVVVVAAAGNYANDGQESGVPYAPGNDPFVITVGAVDLN